MMRRYWQPMAAIHPRALRHETLVPPGSLTPLVRSQATRWRGTAICGSASWLRGEALHLADRPLRYGLERWPYRIVVANHEQNLT